MNLYACLSMGLGDEVGLIEVVLSSTTIAKIQKKGGGASKAFELYNCQLKGKNKTPQE